MSVQYYRKPYQNHSSMNYFHIYLWFYTRWHSVMSSWEQLKALGAMLCFAFPKAYHYSMLGKACVCLLDQPFGDSEWDPSTIRRYFSRILAAFSREAANGPCQSMCFPRHRTWYVPCASEGATSKRESKALSWSQPPHCTQVPQARFGRDWDPPFWMTKEQLRLMRKGGVSNLSPWVHCTYWVNRLEFLINE